MRDQTVAVVLHGRIETRVILGDRADHVGAESAQFERIEVAGSRVFGRHGSIEPSGYEVERLIIAQGDLSGGAGCAAYDSRW